MRKDEDSRKSQKQATRQKLKLLKNLNWSVMDWLIEGASRLQPATKEKDSETGRKDRKQDTWTRHDPYFVIIRLSYHWLTGVTSQPMGDFVCFVLCAREVKCAPLNSYHRFQSKFPAKKPVL